MTHLPSTMARLPRLVVPHLPHHIVQTGIDRQPVFRDADDYANFLRWLRDAARQFNVAIHAYVLMPALLTRRAWQSDATGLGSMMQWVGRQYVPYFNARYRRAGTLWQGRYRAVVIEAGAYLLACSRHIELNPVRSGLAAAAADYPWSSCAHHAGSRPDPLITDHPLYWALGNTPFEREAAYQRLLEQGAGDDENRRLTEAVRSGWPLGSDRFRAELARQASRRVSPGKRGRPAKIPVPAGNDSSGNIHDGNDG